MAEQTAAMTVRDAWTGARDLYEIATITHGNRPVSVYLRSCGTRVWGPGPLWEAEAWIEMQAAEAVVAALGEHRSTDIETTRITDVSI